MPRICPLPCHTYIGSVSIGRDPQRETEKSIVTRASSDQELWSAIASGDARAWELLVRRYEALIYTIATRMGLSMQDAADCFQQTWLLLYKSRKSISQPERLSAWLTTTAKREALRIRRRARPDVDIESVPAPADLNPTADAELEALEERARLEAAIGRLDERCARLVHALFFDPQERSYDEIARDMGIPRNSMGPVRGRCLGRLKQLLDGDK